MPREIRSLWATIYEIEPGLFQSVYSNAGTAACLDELPAYQTGSCVSEARQHFEQSAIKLGFGPITWIDIDMTHFSARRKGPASASHRAGLSV
jgi:hypothetical protein